MELACGKATDGAAVAAVQVLEGVRERAVVVTDRVAGLRIGPVVLRVGAGPVVLAAENVGQFEIDGKFAGSGHGLQFCVCLSRGSAFFRALF